MKHVAALVIVGLALLSCVNTPQGGPPSAAPLSGERLKLVRASCFEVVTQKTPQDSLSYSKPLNWDLQDYTVRNDRYIPLLLWWAIESKSMSDAQLLLQLFLPADAWQAPLVRNTVVERLARRYLAERSQAGY